MSVKIVLDSTADLVPELKDKFEVVHLTVNFGDKSGILNWHESKTKKENQNIASIDK